MIAEGLAPFILHRRFELGLMQKDLAQQVGISAAYMAQIESGNRKWPKKYIAQLATALRVTQSELAIAAGIIQVQERNELVVGCSATEQAA